MNNEVDDVFDYVKCFDRYKPVLGLVGTGYDNQSDLVWAARHSETGHIWSPGLDVIQQTNPSAQWIALTPSQLRSYLRTSKEPAFLYSELAEINS